MRNYNEIRKEIFPRMYDVYNIFQQFFGEDNVDLQGVPDLPISDDEELTEEKVDYIKLVLRDYRPFILVYWKKVKITNDYNKVIYIDDLFAKITITLDGTIPYESNGFKLNRSTYALSQWNNNYLHSHIPRIPKVCLTEFQNPCLGTGPITQTILSLHNDYDEVMWQLFCQELAVYVTVESLRGGPYKYLEEVTKQRKRIDYSYENFDMDRQMRNYIPTGAYSFLKDFTKYYAKNGHFAVSYKKGKYVCGLSAFDLFIDMSNTFIKFYNETKRKDKDDLTAIGILKERIVIDRRIYLTESNRFETDNNWERSIGKYVCTFKGKPITLNIYNDSRQNEDNTPALLLGAPIISRILFLILNIINYEYRRNENQTTDTQSQERVLYI